MNNKTVFTVLPFALIFAFTMLSAQEYPKAILRGDYPDPSIVRDGGDYYMTHSPFVYSPGFLIWHSKDLINWEPVCRALTSHTGSAMAPDLVKYNNRFFIYYPAADTNWVIWADNIRGPYYAKGDLGIMYVINQPNDTRFATIFNSNSVIYEKTGKTIPSVYVAYSAEPNKSLLSDKRFPSLSKHFDAARTAINDNRGLRDMVVARSAETYLMAAEAKIWLAALGTGTYASALDYINVVRKRAAYKDGENRAAYTDGGAAYPVSELKQDPIDNSLILENSYYESNNIPVATSATDLMITSTSSLPAQDEAIISKLGVSGEYNRMLCLVLNERSRELVGEFLRWEDLSRTKTLVARAKAYNPEAAPDVKDYHMLRPIPQTFLNGIQKTGQALTSEEKQAMQNPGY